MAAATDVRALEVDGWDPRLAPIVEEMRGRPLNVHGLLANNPDLLLAWWGFRNHVVHGGKLTQRHRELAVLRVAVRMQCWYEWASHVERGLEAGLSTDEIEAVRTAGPAGDWIAADQLVIQAIDDCFNERRISHRTYTAMRAHFSPGEVMDLVAICGAYITLGTMINTWGLELDTFVENPVAAGAASWQSE